MIVDMDEQVTSFEASLSKPGWLDVDVDVDREIAAPGALTSTPRNLTTLAFWTHPSRIANLVQNFISSMVWYFARNQKALWRPTAIEF